MNSLNLRIGNYVETEDSVVEIVAVHGQDRDIMVRLPSKKITGIKPVTIKPILLAPDMLVRNCGFDHNCKHVIGIDYERYHLWFANGYITLSNKKNVPVIHFWDVRHLHQLQNLYFALKGEEIKISLDGFR